MMEICSATADSQTTRLDEFVLVSRRIRKAGRGAHASSPTNRKCSPTANGFLDFASPELCATPAKLISPILGEEIGKEGGNAGSNQATLVASQDRSRLQQQGKEAKALQPKSYGGPRGEPPQRSSTLIAPLDIASKPRESETEGAGGSHTHQVPPKGDPSHPRKSEVYYVSVGPGRSSEGSDIAACRYQAIGKDQPLRGYGKGVESEELIAKEFDKLSDHPLAPFSDRATKQRDRCRFPRGGGDPRPIANRLQHGNSGRFSNRLSGSDARKRGEES
jgi:hypothetical protein